MTDAGAFHSRRESCSDIAAFSLIKRANVGGIRWPHLTVVPRGDTLAPPPDLRDSYFQQPNALLMTVTGPVFSHDQAELFEPENVPLR
jgi:hypothetical protein